MIGIAFIVIGIIVLLETLGILTGVSAGFVWGAAFIIIGIAMVMRRNTRRKRRMEWIAKHKESGGAHGFRGNNPGGPDHVA